MPNIYTSGPYLHGYIILTRHPEDPEKEKLNKVQTLSIYNQYTSNTQSINNPHYNLPTVSRPIYFYITSLPIYSITCPHVMFGRTGDC